MFNIFVTMFVHAIIYTKFCINYEAEKLKGKVIEYAVLCSDILNIT